MRNELGESITDPRTVTIVEWANKITDVLPEDRLVIEIQSTGEEQRIFSLTAGRDHSHIIEYLK